MIFLFQPESLPLQISSLSALSHSVYCDIIYKILPRQERSQKITIYHFKLLWLVPLHFKNIKGETCLTTGLQVDKGLTGEHSTRRFHSPVSCLLPEPV